MAKIRKVTDAASTSRAVAAANEFEELVEDATIPIDPEQPSSKALPITSASRRRQSRGDRPLDLSESLDLKPDDTILYLAYGSNLSDKKFLGDRGIRPLSVINVQVPALKMIFDLAGIPYLEPCFANSTWRPTDASTSKSDQEVDEKAPLVSPGTKYNKDKWKKPMIGVVYELTAADFAKVLATEGAGSSYQDIVVDCYPFASSDPSAEVPWKPETEPLSAHTLFAPRSSISGSRVRKPGYAQPSARYLGLLTEGAKQRDLPFEYQEYLASIRPYNVRTNRQVVARAIYSWTIIPVFMAILRSGKHLSDETGRAPAWYQRVIQSIFATTWWSYDWLCRPLFGDGERDITT